MRWKFLPLALGFLLLPTASFAAVSYTNTPSIDTTGADPVTFPQSITLHTHVEFTNISDVCEAPNNNFWWVYVTNTANSTFVPTQTAGYPAATMSIDADFPTLPVDDYYSFYVACNSIDDFDSSTVYTEGELLNALTPPANNVATLFSVVPDPVVPSSDCTTFVCFVNAASATTSLAAVSIYSSAFFDGMLPIGLALVGIIVAGILVSAMSAAMVNSTRKVVGGPTRRARHHRAQWRQRSRNINRWFDNHPGMGA